jgi:S1 RNA binding domain
MDSDEPRITWPIIGQSDVADFCERMQRAVVDLERAFEAGELASRLAARGFEPVLGPRLFETYRRLADAAPGPLQPLRVHAVEALIAQLQNDLSPTYVAHARVRTLAEGDPQVSVSEASLGPILRSKVVDASFQGAPVGTLRVDQMLDVRFWRIGFEFETLDFGDAFAQLIVRRASNRLASDLLAVQQILSRFNRRALDPELRIVPHPKDRRFEHLILDVLNEDAHRARVAPLLEDFLEKTDLRVRYPGLERKRGGRIQVTSIIASDLHETKIQGIRLADEFVFLSPLSLAKFVESLRRYSSAGRVFASFELAALWDCLEAKPSTVPELASELRRVMFAAFAVAPDSPLGPLMRVPKPIRELVRLFVETRAIASTRRLREREQRESRNTASSGNRLADVHREEEQLGFLRALRVGSRVRGRVRNIVGYGAFIDLGPVNGLLHISGIPSAVSGMIGQNLTKGDEIEVEVLEVDIDKRRVSLRMPVGDPNGG